MSKLTDKQEFFCQEYIKDFNGTQAAIRAGYSKKSARQVAADNLSKHDIQNRLNELKSEVSRRNDIEVDEIVQYLASIMRVDPLEIFDSKGRLKDLEEMTEAARMSIQSIQLQEENKLGGEDIKVVTKRMVKLYSKMDAVEKLMKHLGGYEADNRRTLEVRHTPYDSLSVDDLEKLAEIGDKIHGEPSEDTKPGAAR